MLITALEGELESTGDEGLHLNLCQLKTLCRCSLCLPPGLAAHKAATTMLTKSCLMASVESRDRAPCYNALMSQSTDTLDRHIYV